VSLAPGINGYQLATGLVAGGTSVISATQGGLTGSIPIKVKSASLQSIAVSIDSSPVTCSSSALFTAQGLYADGSTLDVTMSATWAADTLTFLNTDIGPLYGTSTCAGSGVGTHTVTAKLNGVTGTASLVVTPLP